MVEISQFGWFGILFALLIGHALGDFAFQTEFVSQAKCKVYWGADSGKWDWLVILSAHSLIHAGFVWAITGSLWYGVAEFVLHGIIDQTKCSRRLGFLSDQLLHIGCKVSYVLCLVIFPS
ncbi:MAG: DUF3307 domain-containing protein [Roseibacillus sp.]